MKPTVIIVGHFPPARGGIASLLGTILQSELAHRYALLPFDIRRPTKQQVFHNFGYRSFINAGVRRALVALLIGLWNVSRFPFIVLWKRPALVHIHTAPFFLFWETAYYLFVSYLFRLPTVLQFHSSFQYFYQCSGPYAQKLMLWILTYATRFIVICREDERFLAAKSPDKIQCCYLPNFIDVAAFRRQFEQEQISHQKKTLPVVLFLGGNDAAHKGFRDLLQALQLLTPRPACRFVFAAVPRAEILAELPEDYLDTCEVHSWVSGPTKAALFAKAQIFVLLSYAEGMPIAILEAMAAAAAVIATNVGGIPDLITNGREGYLENPGDIAGIARALFSLMTDAPLRLAMGQKGLEKVRQHYDVSVGAHQLHTLYQGVLSFLDSEHAAQTTGSVGSKL